MSLTPIHSSTLKGALLGRGYTCEEFRLDSRRYRQYRSPGSRVMITKGMYYDYPFVSATTRQVSKNKLMSYEFAQMNGVSIPATLQTADLKEATQFLERYKCVVVKPLAGGGSRGLTLDIVTPRELEPALELANRNGHSSLIQEQFAGEELRFTILKGVVRSVILRQSPRVVGDGHRGVHELIDAENSDRKKLSFPLLVYPQLDESNVDSAQFKRRDIVPAGEVIELSKTTMIGKGASFYGVTDTVHKSYIAIAERLAHRLNPAMLIVDLMMKDYTLPATDSNYIFLEFNTAPGLAIYSSLRAGDQPDVIKMLADMIDEYVAIY